MGAGADKVRHRCPGGVCARAAPTNPPVPSVATLASRNLRISSSYLRRPGQRTLKPHPEKLTEGQQTSGKYETTARDLATGDKYSSWQLRNTVAVMPQASGQGADGSDCMAGPSRQAPNRGAVDAAEGSDRQSRRPCQSRPADRTQGNRIWMAQGGEGGERKASEAPARRARTRSASPWAELVMRPRRRWTPGQRPARRCIPAPSVAASLASPATTRARRRARQILARSRPSAARPGSPSWRSTTPASPRGRRATAGRGSGSRRASVNSQRTGSSEPRRRRAHAQASRRLSIVRRARVC